MKSALPKILIALAVIVLLLAATLGSVYFFGMKKYGTPSEYRAREEERIAALMDSLSEVRGIGSPVNLGDSTMVGLPGHTAVFERESELGRQLSAIQAALDSLKREKDDVLRMSRDLELERKLFNDFVENARRENIINLANLYDSMKPQQSVPLFTAMNDTLAVMIISNMEDRSAGRVLAGVAADDIGKAERLNTLLSEMGVTQD